MELAKPIDCASCGGEAIDVEHIFGTFVVDGKPRKLCGSCWLFCASTVRSQIRARDWNGDNDETA
jgi:hypothetical protein